MLVGVLVEPDEGEGGATVRWPGPVVTYRVDLPGYPDWFTAEVRAAFAWVGEHSSLQVTEVTGGGADIDVVAGGSSIGDGAHTTAQVAGGGVIVNATVQLGCCRRRPVWEDVAQAFGPLGDRAGDDSVFSQTRTRELPSCFDAAVLRTLYTMPAGTSPAAIIPVARAVLDVTCGDHLSAQRVSTRGEC